MKNFEYIFELAQGESSSLGVISAIMDIIRDVDSGLVLKTFTDHKGKDMSIETIPINNNLCVIGSIDFNARFSYIHSEKFVQNHVGHEYDTNSVFFLPMEIPLAPNQMTPPLCCLVQDYTKS